jgi:hypothetical protein
MKPRPSATTTSLPTTARPSHASRPSRSPSISPVSAKPSRAPSSRPSKRPSALPTAAPMSSPTARPASPTGSPTMQPTQRPHPSNATVCCRSLTSAALERMLPLRRVTRALWSASLLAIPTPRSVLFAAPSELRTYVRPIPGECDGVGNSGCETTFGAASACSNGAVTCTSASDCRSQSVGRTLLRRLAVASCTCLDAQCDTSDRGACDTSGGPDCCSDTPTEVQSDDFNCCSCGYACERGMPCISGGYATG